MASDPYALACFAVESGAMGEARRHLEVAFALDPALRAAALDEPELDGFWRSLGAGDDGNDWI